MNLLKSDFLLESSLAQELFLHASSLPIIDFHCHLNPQMIAENYRFKNITEVWLKGDHYKWRLMRACGVDENLITGDADDRDKFIAFASILPLCIGNPIYIWCHLELARYFGYNGELNNSTSSKVYDLCNEKIYDASFSAKNLIVNSNVKAVCTTDDPIDDLSYHAKVKSDNDFKVAVLPTFRPDQAIHIERNGFNGYIEKLGIIVGKKIITAADIVLALETRLEDFIKNGCLITDHALDRFGCCLCTENEVNDIFAMRLNGDFISLQQIEKYQTFILISLAKMYSYKNIAMQLHYNCQRNVNAPMFDKLGADTGYDCIANSANSFKLSELLNQLHKQDCLPKTIIYSLNPYDNNLINSVIGAFQGKIKGKLQHGSAWWFNDTKSGMIAQITALAEGGVLGNFIGMLTDSRSFLSYTRHEYFRRILCNFIANQVNCGEYPNNKNALLELVENISYKNAIEYFNFKL